MSQKPNVFDELIAKLKAVTDALKAVAEQMKKSVESQAASNERLREINRKLRATFPSLQRQRESLDAAGRALARTVETQKRMNASLAAAPPLRDTPRAEPKPQNVSVDVFPMPPPSLEARPIERHSREFRRRLSRRHFN